MLVLAAADAAAANLFFDTQKNLAIVSKMMDWTDKERKNKKERDVSSFKFFNFFVAKISSRILLRNDGRVDGSSYSRS